MARALLAGLLAWAVTSGLEPSPTLAESPDPTIAEAPAAPPTGEPTDEAAPSDDAGERDDDRDDDFEARVQLVLVRTIDVHPPFGGATSVDALATHAAPTEAHQSAIERPPRA